jgi:demethylmenaquinone methyltransferase/2-methoxy-6-polyprenyl-1,4-benzoquinol methylase
MEVSYLDIASWIHRVTEPAIRSAIRALQLPTGSRGLDIGCGIGTHTLWLAEAVSPEGHVTGIDISSDHLARADELASKNKLAAQVSFQHGDMEALSFEANAFDWTWNADTLWPVAGREPLLLVKNLKRVVKPGGTMAVLFWSSQRLLPGYPLLEARLNATDAANFPYTDDTRSEWHILRAMGWLQEAGLSDLQVRTFVADIRAPLDDAAQSALAWTFQMLWGKTEPELTPKDWSQFQQLCQLDSPDCILHLPDYYAFITYSLFWGKVAEFS